MSMDMSDEDEKALENAEEQDMGLFSREKGGASQKDMGFSNRDTFKPQAIETHGMKDRSQEVYEPNPKPNYDRDFRPFGKEDKGKVGEAKVATKGDRPGSIAEQYHRGGNYSGPVEK